MTLKVSRGLRNGMLVTDSFKGLMEAGSGCALKIYSGTVPTNARDAIAAGNTLLVTITKDGTGDGLTFETSASQGTLSKTSGENWEGTIQASGIATFYRLVADGDTGNASDTEPRLQGAVDTAGAELNLSSVDLVDGGVQTIDYFVVNIPTL